MIVYLVRYEDGDVEFCHFYRNKREAMRGRTQYKKQFKKMGSVEKFSIGRDKGSFLNLFEKYAIKSRAV